MPVPNLTASRKGEGGGFMEESSLSILVKVLFVFFFIGLNAFFVSAEFALVLVKKAALEKKAREGNRAALAAVRFLNNPDRFIATVQLGVTMASLALGWVGEETVASLLIPPLAEALGKLGIPIAHGVGLILSFGTITFLHIVLGEQVPKSVSLRMPERIGLLSALPIHWFYMAFRPFIWLLDRSTALVLRPFGVPVGTEIRSVHTVEELRMLVKESYERGLLEEMEEELLSRVFDFGERTVKEVMIPRTEIVGIEADATIADFLREFKRSRHARYPVYEGNLDNIIGFVAIKDVLLNINESLECFQKKMRDLVRPAYIVPESKFVDELLVEMRTHHLQMAVVIDEYGGTAGLVTLEELLEEIVGRVSDETAVEQLPLEQVDEGVYYVDARLRVDELNEELGLNLPEGEDYETLAGFIYTRWQRIPREGEEFRYNNLLITVTEMKGPRIVKVRLKKLPS
ncbi:MAG: hypothetical protein DRI61_03525 [Chloroflexi bacterium]|nr:MAG: hypothetical protein DRI61_03525 [Chloroflexota bacterium]